MMCVMRVSWSHGVDDLSDGGEAGLKLESFMLLALRVVAAGLRLCLCSCGAMALPPHGCHLRCVAVLPSCMQTAMLPHHMLV